MQHRGWEYMLRGDVEVDIVNQVFDTALFHDDNGVPMLGLDLGV